MNQSCYHINLYLQAATHAFVNEKFMIKKVVNSGEYKGKWNELRSPKS